MFPRIAANLGNRPMGRPKTLQRLLGSERIISRSYKALIPQPPAGSQLVRSGVGGNVLNDALGFFWPARFDGSLL
jgi:hypothetical protein